jgi:putative intracellular protease/amidase
MFTMKRILLSISVALLATAATAQHNAGHNGKVLLIASNPAVSQQTGWPIGVWAAEVVHPYWEFTQAGYSVDIASPDGGEVKIDAFSDPEDASRYAAWDLLSLGFLKDPAKSALLKNTLKLSAVNPNDYKALLVCGGQGPMYTFIDNGALHRFFVDFYLTGKPTAAICHGTCILLKAKLPNGKYLVAGKKWTGFANNEENYADAYVGKKIQPFRIEDEARKMPNNRFVVAPMFEAHAVQDGNLITGQQQNSGAEAARLVIAQLNRQRAKWPTYLLVHGAWADESA